MMVFSEIHNQCGDTKNQQILVFATPSLENLFLNEFYKRIQKNGIALSSDTAAGATFKLKAIQLPDGKYNSQVRCGNKNTILWEESVTGNFTYALLMAMIHLYTVILFTDNEDGMAHRDKQILYEYAKTQFDTIKTSQTGNYEFLK